MLGKLSSSATAPLAVAKWPVDVRRNQWLEAAAFALLSGDCQQQGEIQHWLLSRDATAIESWYSSSELAPLHMLMCSLHGSKGGCSSNAKQHNIW